MASLTPVFVDFESFWSTTHSLTKMSPIAYVTHPETEIISCAIKVGKYNTDVFFGEENIRKVLSKIDWSNKFVIAHNNEGFDSMLLAWRLGVRPAMWGCTLAMARPIHAKTPGLSLAKLVEHYGLGVKDNTALVNTKGKHLKDFTEAELDAMREYNKADTEQCAALFHKLLPLTRKDELRLIDMTIRMLVEPQFEVDQRLLKTTLKAERARKQQMLVDLATMVGAYEAGMSDEEAADAVCKTLGSAQKFGQLLRDLGVEVPTKISPTTGKEAPALAKTDEGFLALAEHDDPVVAAAANARLGVKSTLLETRIEAFLQAAEATGGSLPVPLKYCGADTTGRWSGWAFNPQNLPRVSGKPSDALRNCLMAPAGHKIIVADLSGIELRVNHFLWKVPSSMALFEADPEKADLYKEFASALYQIDRTAVTKDQRQVGKVAHLGLGFGAGGATFRKVAKLMAGIELSGDEAADIVAKWRASYPEIAKGWRTCHDALKDIFAGVEKPIDPWGMCVTCAEGIRTPKGIIRYPELRQEVNDEGKKEWFYGDGRHKARIYAGKITENCLAAGTLVLTDNGWKPIERVALEDKVHDGDEFVAHAGTIFKSVQQCVTVDGVYMTADHEVLNEQGIWEEASQLPRPYRPEVRSADRLGAISQRREAVELDVEVRLREPVYQERAGHHQGGEAWGVSQLRVSDALTDSQRKLNARYEQAPRVCGMAQHARSVPTPDASGLGQLRWAWDCGVRKVAGVFRELLGGYGTHVPAGAGLGSQGQQRAVFSGELPVGFTSNEYAKQTELPTCGHTGAIRENRDSKVNPILQVGDGQTVNRYGGQTQIYEVYDIANAGPQHRFVVLGNEGPFIVHNCVQHLARCIIADNALEFRKQTGLSPALMVHDELVYVTQEKRAESLLGTLQEIMRTPPVWWPELVTWSEGDIADTYGAAK